MAGGLTAISTALQNIAQNLGKLVGQTSLGIVVPIAQGGTGATDASDARDNLGIVNGSTPANGHVAVFVSGNQIEDGGQAGVYLGGSLVGANFNVTSDQAIALSLPPASTDYVVEAVIVSNATAGLSVAIGGIYSAPGKTGVQVVSSGQDYGALVGGTPNTVGTAMAATTTPNAILNVTTLYFSLTTPQGTNCTADIRVYIRPLW